MVTAKDVARIAGVSQPTVSRVVAGNPKVSEEIRDRVLAVMRETGYRPNAAARAMRTGSSGNIGVVTARLHNPMYPELLELLGRRLRAANLRMMVWNADEIEGPFELDAVRQGMVDGMIFTSATADSAHLNEALVGQVPVVLINRGVDGWPSDQVTSDNISGGALAAKFFLKNDRKHVGLITGPQEPSTIRDREAGFRSAMSEAGITEIPTARVLAFTYEEALRVTHELLQANDAPPDTLFCANDVIAFGALDAVRSAGLRVPEDVWVVGYDDVPLAAWRAFDLSTVRQPLELMVNNAVDLLLRRLDGDVSPPVITRIPAELILRGSSAGEA